MYSVSLQLNFWSFCTLPFTFCSCCTCLTNAYTKDSSKHSLSYGNMQVPELLEKSYNSAVCDSEFMIFTFNWILRAASEDYFSVSLVCHSLLKLVITLPLLLLEVPLKSQRIFNPEIFTNFLPTSLHGSLFPLSFR